MAEVKKGEGLVYKNHPLRRIDNLIYYGSMADKYIVMLQILETKKDQDMDVATKVSVQLQLTDPDLKSRDRVVKKSEKNSLYAAMDVGCIWLERAQVNCNGSTLPQTPQRRTAPAHLCTDYHPLPRYQGVGSTARSRYHLLRGSGSGASLSCIRCGTERKKAGTTPSSSQ